MFQELKLLWAIKKAKDGNMKDLFKWLDIALAKLPFNGYKLNIGTVITWLGLLDIVLQSALPFLHTLSTVLPPQYLTIVGVVISAIGLIHKVAKKANEAK